MKKLLAVIAGIALLVLLLLFGTANTVNYHQVAIKTTFSRPSDVIREPGVHFAVPLVSRIKKFDTRLQLLETPLETIPTADGKQVVVRAFLLWRINTEGEGPRIFNESFDTEGKARGSLETQLRSALSALSEYELDELLSRSSALEQAEERIRTRMETELAGKGITPQVIGISQLQLPPTTSQAVVNKMVTTMEVLARQEQVSGAAMASTIRADAANNVDKIRSFAQRVAEELKAAGNREAARNLAVMAENEDFAIFLVWLNTLREALSTDTTYFLQTNTEPMHLLDPKTANARGGIPWPSDSMLSDAGVPAPRVQSPTATPDASDNDEASSDTTADRGS